MFHIGQLVVCIDDTPKPELSRWHKITTLPTKGMVYTIRDIIPAPGSAVEPAIVILLEEITNPPIKYAWGTHEIAFDPHRFRPVKKTSIDCFTALLTKTPELVE